jgi:uncharacterized protein
MSMVAIKFNVAQLLREQVGARRDYTFTEERLHLDDTLVLRDIQGHVRFTRTTTGVFAHVRGQGLVQLTCVRSLEEFDYRVDFDFSDQFHSVIDVVTGISLPTPTEDDPFMLDELHMADVGEAIREYTLINLPINPVAEAYRDQPVSYSVQSVDINETDDQEGEQIDSRLAALKNWAARQNNQD